MHKEHKGGNSLFVQNKEDSSGRRASVFTAETVPLLFVQVFAKYAYLSVVTVLQHFVVDRLQFSGLDANTLQVTFLFWVYLCSLPCAFFADSLWGRYKTVLVALIMYCSGLVLVTLCAVFAMMQLVDVGLVGLISGIICVGLGQGSLDTALPPFLADQLPLDSELLSPLFRVFFWASNFGTFFGILTSPLLVQYVGFWLALSIPLVAMLLALLIFILSRKKFRDVVPLGNVLASCFGVAHSAISNKMGSKTAGLDSLAIQPKNWLDWAKVEHDPDMVDGLSHALDTLGVFSPLCILWAIFFHIFNVWKLQALELDLNIGSLLLSSEQTPLLRPLCVMIVIPIINIFLPTIERCAARISPSTTVVQNTRDFTKPGIQKGERPLLRMAIGMLFVVCALVSSLILEIFIVNGDGQSISILAQIPQYLALAVSETFTVVPTLVLSYSETPDFMKSFMYSLVIVITALGYVITLLTGPPLTANLSKISVIILLGSVTFGLVGAFYFLFVRRFKYWLEMQSSLRVSESSEDFKMSSAWKTSAPLFLDSDDSSGEHQEGNMDIEDSDEERKL